MGKYYILGGPGAGAIDKMIDSFQESKRPLAVNPEFKIYSEREGGSRVIMTNLEISEIIPYENFNASYKFRGKAILRIGSEPPKHSAIEIKYSAITKNGRVYTQ